MISYLLGVLISSVFAYIFIRLFKNEFEGEELLIFLLTSIMSWAAVPLSLFGICIILLVKLNIDWDKASKKFFTIGNKKE